MEWICEYEFKKRYRGITVSYTHLSERTPSFRVNVAKQLWYDFGLGKGGDIFTLAGEFLQSDDFMKRCV